MEMHGADICQLRQVSTDNSSDNHNTLADKCPKTVAATPPTTAMEQPTVIIPNPLTNLTIQSNIAYGGSGGGADHLEPMSYHQHHSGESSPLMQQQQQQHHHQTLDHHHHQNNVWPAYNDNQYSQPQRSLVITPVTAAAHFPADVTEMRDHLQYSATAAAAVMDDNNNHTLHHLATSLKDEHCLHASPVSHHGGSSQNGSPEHHGQSGGGGSNGQFLNLGSAHSTISENLSQLKYTRQHHHHHTRCAAASQYCVVAQFNKR